MCIPRPEHPRRQFQRANWINLSGQWNFRINHDDSSLEAGWVQDPKPLDRQAKFDAQRLRQAFAATATIEQTYAVEMDIFTAFQERLDRNFAPAPTCERPA